MRVLKQLFFMLVALPILVSCNTHEGEGGTGTVLGYVKLVQHPDDDYLLTTDTIAAAKTDVFIVYGDDAFYGDDTETNPDGLYQFDYLTPGKYTVFAYSTLTTGERVAVSETVELGNGEAVQAPTIPTVKALAQTAVVGVAREVGGVDVGSGFLVGASHLGQLLS